MNRYVKDFVTVSVPATIATVLLVAVAVEIWVRLSWDPLRGTPGLFVSDPRRVERLAPNYSGWLSGVPVRTNNLGFRDSRDYTVHKKPSAFRILMLGDSVTFGQGGLYAYTYPYLVESKLKAWRPDVGWEVWNLGVPGYNTAQELAYLEEVGPAYQPDLVIVGFYENDLYENETVREATRARAFKSKVMQFLRMHLYSFEFYKKAYLQVSWKFFMSDTHRKLFENLKKEEALLARVDQVRNIREQEAVPFEHLANRDAMMSGCDDTAGLVSRSVGAGVSRPKVRLKADPTPVVKPVLGTSDSTFGETVERVYTAWLVNVRAFQDLHRQGRYRIVFFINKTPDICEADDLFYRGRSRIAHDYFVNVLSNGTPAVSTYDAFYHTRPSQMPAAGGHALGSANLVKAEVLFRYLQDYLGKG